MSAYLDRSQGFTFVFSNIYDLYKKAKDAKLDDPYLAEIKPEVKLKKEEFGRVIKSGDAQLKVKDFKPESLNSERPFPVPMGVREAEEKAMRMNAKPLHDLKKNLAELKDAQSKLRFLLKELEELSDKKKGK